jgi:hypothetical protein
VEKRARLRRWLKSEECRSRERSAAAWIGDTSAAVEVDWDRRVAETALNGWDQQEFVSAIGLLTSTLKRYFDRALHVFQVAGVSVRASKPQPILYVVDVELWREQWTIRSRIYMPTWRQQVERQHLNTLRVYSRLRLLSEELRRRVAEGDRDLIRGLLFNDRDSYDRTLDHLVRTRVSHPDDGWDQREEEKRGVARVALAQAISRSADVAIPPCKEKQLAEMQLAPEVLRDLEGACSVAEHQRVYEESEIDRRDSGFLLRTLDGSHRYLPHTLECDVIDEIKRHGAAKRTSSSFAEQNANVNTSGDAAISDDAITALKELNDVQEKLDLEMRAQSLASEQLDLLRTILTCGVTETAELARMMGVSRPTMYARKARLAADLERLGLTRATRASHRDS